MGLAVREAAADCVVRLGQVGEGLEPQQLQAPLQSCGPLRAALRIDDLAGWVALRLWREGWHGDALGRERRQAPLLARCVGADSGALLQPEELLALRRDGHVDQNLGFGEQERPGRDPPAVKNKTGLPWLV